MKYIDEAPDTIAKEFNPGDLVVYSRDGGDHFEIGVVKRIDSDGAFVWYHTGDTAAKTPWRCLHKVSNAYAVRSLISRIEEVV